MPTATDLLNLTGIGQRSSDFRFDLLDFTLATIGTFQPNADTPPTLSNDTTRTIKRTLQGLTLSPGVLTSINPFSDLVQPSMILENGVEYPLGVLAFADASNLLESYGTVVTANLNDLNVVLDQPTATPTVAPVGTVISTLLAALLSATPIGDRFTVDASAATVQGADLAWPAGTSLLSIINSLGLTAGYLPLYFDRYGHAILRIAPDFSLADADLDYEDGRFIPGTASTNIALLEAPNRYIVTDTSATSSPVVGVWDIPSSAPNSAFNRGGYVQAKTLTLQGLGSIGAANQAAMAYGQQDQANYGKAAFTTVFDPRHETYDVVDFLGVNYLELAWGGQLREGADMTHSLKSVYVT